MENTTDQPTGICPECGEEFFCGETTCESSEHDECDIEQIKNSLSAGKPGGR